MAINPVLYMLDNLTENLVIGTLVWNNIGVINLLSEITAMGIKCEVDLQ